MIVVMLTRTAGRQEHNKHNGRGRPSRTCRQLPKEQLNRGVFLVVQWILDKIIIFHYICVSPVWLTVCPERGVRNNIARQKGEIRRGMATRAGYKKNLRNAWWAKEFRDSEKDIEGHIRAGRLPNPFFVQQLVDLDERHAPGNKRDVVVQQLYEKKKLERVRRGVYRMPLKPQVVDSDDPQQGISDTDYAELLELTCLLYEEAKANTRSTEEVEAFAGDEFVQEALTREDIKKEDDCYVLAQAHVTWDVEEKKKGRKGGDDTVAAKTRTKKKPVQVRMWDLRMATGARDVSISDDGHVIGLPKTSRHSFFSNAVRDGWFRKAKDGMYPWARNPLLPLQKLREAFGDALFNKKAARSTTGLKNEDLDSLLRIAVKYEWVEKGEERATFKLIRNPCEEPDHECRKSDTAPKPPSDEPVRSDRTDAEVLAKLEDDRRGLQRKAAELEPAIAELRKREAERILKELLEAPPEVRALIATTSSPAQAESLGFTHPSEIQARIDEAVREAQLPVTSD